MTSGYTLVAVRARRKRRGRGIGGRGAKSGRGMKGQRSRAGSRYKAGFEGGQTPLYMRLPKGRGSKQTFASRVKKPAEVTTNALNKFPSHTVVDLAFLRREKMISRQTRTVKLIGSKKVGVPLVLRVNAATAQARAAVESAGGTLELIAK